MSHYFIKDDALSQKRHDIEYCFKGERFRFVSSAGVFSKDGVDHATGLLLNAIPPLEKNAALLDMGCGYGCIGIVLARTYGVRLTQADVNETAVELTRVNCKRHGVESDVWLSDCFDGIGDRKFDVITLNPPIHAGKAVTYRMYEQSVEYLNSGGRLYVVTLKKHGAESTLAKLCEVYGSGMCSVVYKKKGYYVFECVRG